MRPRADQGLTEWQPVDHHVEEAAYDGAENGGCGDLGCHGLEKLTGGPKGPPVPRRRSWIGYQSPPLGQAPELVVVQVRVTTAPALVMVNLLPDAELPTIV